MDALLREMGSFSKKNILANTLYLGGGTPSLIDIESIEKIIYCAKRFFGLRSTDEITMEINPDTVNEKKLLAIKKAGVNRLSVGVQSFNDFELKKIGRTHSASRAKKVILDAHNLEFNNISIDLIMGLPFQTLKSWEKTLDVATSLNIDHISIYQLKIEKGTSFFKQLPKGLPKDEDVADLYYFSCKKLKKFDFLQYEISNFAKNGKESVHNIKYWTMGEYLGFGASAHSFFNRERFYHNDNIYGYIKDPLCVENETTDINFEWFILGLRLNKGLKINDMQQYGFWSSEFKAKVWCLKREGLLEVERERLKLTTKGMLLQNLVISYLCY